MSGRLPPNPALNRTGRYAPSTWRVAARPAGYLDRWASRNGTARPLLNVGMRWTGDPD